MEVGHTGCHGLYSAKLTLTVPQLWIQTRNGFLAIIARIEYKRRQRRVGYVTSSAGRL